MSLPGNGTESGAPFAAPGYQTQIHPGAYYTSSPVPPGRGALQAWSISSLVLSLLCLLTYGLITILFVVALSGGRSSLLLFCVSAFGAMAAALVAAGSVGTLSGREWGRQAIIAGAIAAISFLAIDFVINLTNNAPGNSPVGSALAGFHTGIWFGAAFGDLGKMLYCALLLRFMLSPAARGAVRA